MTPKTCSPKPELVKRWKLLRRRMAAIEAGDATEDQKRFLTELIGGDDPDFLAWLKSYVESLVRRPRSERRFVYFLGHGTTGTGVVKIGGSDDPIFRLRQLRSKFKLDLSLLGAIHCTALGARGLEASLHWHFRDFRARRKELGREWFWLSEEIERYISLFAAPLTIAEQMAPLDASDDAKFWIERSRMSAFPVQRLATEMVVPVPKQLKASGT